MKLGESITVGQYTLFATNFYLKRPQPLRFGQAFINEFKIEAFEGSNEIFYEPDTKKAQNAIYKYGFVNLKC